uniref:Transposase n=2 Tax=Caenorhabditis japonica TaxID=281687 RepID=A0A8R1IFI2_CAEJA
CGTPAAETVTKIGKALARPPSTIAPCVIGSLVFNREKKCFEDNDRCGRPTALNNDLLRDAVKERLDVITRELETMLGCSHQTISNHLHDLGYRRVLARWVPHALSPYQMQARVTACQSLLLTPQKKEFLADIDTGEESWLLYNNDRAVWIPQEMFPFLLLGRERHAVLRVAPARENGQCYYLLQSAACLALREKRPRRSAVHLLHDNARPHVAKATQEKLQELNWDTVPHPPYSPDIAPSDYHLFRPLKLFLKEKRFAKYEDLKMAVFDFFYSQSAAFWKKGIDDLPERWLTVVTNDGQYIVD